MSGFQMPISMPHAMSPDAFAPARECDTGWYAASTHSNFEKRVAADLASKGVSAYLPVFHEVHRWKDRYKKVDLPLFPGYVFVRISDSDASQVTVRRTQGVVRILGCAGRIERIPDLEIESVQRLISAEVPYLPHPFLREGCMVRVKRGALKGLEGLLVRVKSNVRLVISVNLLSQSVATEIDTCDVEVIRPAR